MRVYTELGTSSNLFEYPADRFINLSIEEKGRVLIRVQGIVEILTREICDLFFANARFKEQIRRKGPKQDIQKQKYSQKLQTLSFLKTETHALSSKVY